MVGQIAKICWWVPKQPQLKYIPQALATLILDNTITKIEQTYDMGASNRMTGKPSMLTNMCKFGSH